MNGSEERPDGNREAERGTNSRLFDIDIRPLSMGLVFLVIALVCTVFIPVTGLTNRIAYSLSDGINTGYLVSGYLILITVALTGHRLLDAKAIAATGIVGTSVVHILKSALGYWTPRPSGNPGGFPSGHACASFILSFLISRRYPRLSLPVFSLAAAISWSRVPLHAHWPYQVAGGGVIGLAIAVLIDSWFCRNKDLQNLPVRQ